MQKLTELEHKFTKIAKELTNLKEENEKLRADLKYLESQTDSKKFKEVRLENEDFKVQKKQIADKLDKLLEKFSRAGI